MSYIYQIINSKTKAVVYLGTTDNLSDLEGKMFRGELPWRGYERYKHKEDLTMNVLEETEHLAERYAFYAWPQLSRIKYQQALCKASLESKVSKSVKNAVDELVVLYPDTNCSFELYLTERGAVAADVFADGVKIERYEFKRSGKAKTREIY